jgi:THO complex subunit 2
MTDVYGAMLPEKARESITMDLFELFFSHSLYDISCPEDQYKAEMARLKKEIERLVQKQKGNPGSLMPGPPFTMDDEMELERVRRASTLLASDMSLQKKRHEKLQRGFQSRKGDCFASETVSTSSIQNFLMHCVYPRCVSTPDDALYCAQFVSLLHQNDTPGFSTMIFIDELVDVMAGAIYCATEDEAANMAIMLLETWKMVSKWRYDDEAFDAEVAGKVRKSNFRSS